MLASFAVVFAAGVAVGLVLAWSARASHRRSWLAGELDLTPQQREQMREIWSQPDQRAQMRSHFERSRAIREQRDEALRALLTEEQKARHDELLQEYEQQLNELNEERRKAFEEKVQRTKEILTEPQRKKYEELLGRGPGPRRRSEEGWPQGRGGEPGSGPFRENRNGAGGRSSGSFGRPGRAPGTVMVWVSFPRGEGHV